MMYKAYRDTGTYPSPVVQLIPSDGRDAEKEARAFFGQHCECIGEFDGAQFQQSPNNPDWKIAYVY